MYEDVLIVVIMIWIIALTIVIGRTFYHMVGTHRIYIVGIFLVS